MRLDSRLPVSSPRRQPPVGSASAAPTPVAASVALTPERSPARKPDRSWKDAISDFLGDLKHEAGSALLEGYHAVGGMLDSFVRFSPEKASPPSHGHHLRAVSYNVMLGGKDFPGILATLRKANPDVAGLQVVSRANAERLGKELGMHVAFYGETKVPFADPVGKAILSKYPLTSAKHETFLSSDSHWEAIRRYAESNGKPLHDAVFRTELSALRGSLEATFEAGGKTFALLDTHLTLKDPRLNAAQLDLLRQKAAAYEAKGFEVIMVGDFNTNLALKGGPSTPGAAFADETDTVAEWKERYGKANPGNIGDGADMEAADALRSELKSAWDASEKRYSVTPGDAETTPEEARALLASGRYARGSEEWKVLAAAADGVTHLGAEKRFDNILVSEGLRVKEAGIDMTSKASDHQLVLADLTW